MNKPGGKRFNPTEGRMRHEKIIDRCAGPVDGIGVILFRVGVSPPSIADDEYERALVDAGRHGELRMLVLSFCGSVTRGL